MHHNTNLPLIRKAAAERYGLHPPQHTAVSRHRLSPSDMHDYERLGREEPNADTFIKIARICCNLGQRFPRKELHESFEAALLTHTHFPEASIVVDGAAGHGLVGLILLVLDQSSKRVCLAVDRERPSAAVLLAEAFEKEWGLGLRRRYSFVEGDLQLITPPPRSLLISIHGCGSLSDVLIDKAIESSCDLAIVPCCQAGSQYLPKRGARPTTMPLLFKHYKTRGVKEAQIHTSKMGARFGVALAVDAARVTSLRSSGYKVVIKKLPEGITGRARVIFARIPGDPMPALPVSSEPLSTMWPEQALPESPWTRFKNG
jgi:hypothetical protein